MFSIKLINIPISVVKRHIWFESEPGLGVIIVQETIPLGLSGDGATHPTRTEKTKLNIFR